MKKALLLTLLISIGYLSTHAERIEWLHSIKKAKAIAQELGKPMLLDFTAKWCEPCMYMDRVFWPRPDVVQFAKRFVCVKVDYDRSKGLKRKYRIKAIPFVIATDPWGRELASQRGFNGNGRSMMRKLAYVPADFSEIVRFETALKANDKNLDALRSVGKFYQSRKLYKVSSSYLSRVLKLSVDAAEREDLMLKLAMNYAHMGVYGAAKSWFKKFQKEFPKSKRSDHVIYVELVLSIRKENTEIAEKLLTELTTRFPNSIYLNPAYDAINSAWN